jgi:predicted Zn-dependent peptidase
MGELAEAKKRSRLSFLKLMDSDSGLAQALAKNEAIHGDWRVLIRLYDLIEETTLSDLQNLVRRFLQPANRTVVSIEKKGQ